MLIYNYETKNLIDEVDTNKKAVSFLYNNFFGRIILKIAISPKISKLNGIRYSSKKSTKKIGKFVTKNGIDLSDYPSKKYKSFNDFFTREITKEKRPISFNKNELISPADSLLTVYEISDKLTFNMKNSVYTIEELLKNKELAQKYNGGYLLVFRLTVRDYHRYIYIDDGQREEYVKIPGVLHTVNPIACKKVKVYSENSREYTVLHTKNFDDVIQVEVGALMVGKIKNNKTKEFCRGDEKGYFEFGGSTIIMLFKKDTIKIDNEVLNYSKKEIETRLKCGVTIGSSCKWTFFEGKGQIL